ncbi:MAG TPA: hypothetical protein VFW25_02320 [Silvibacterium sp.]|nr:hypothetical protein [Silvibacterium sp.]
MAKCKYCGKWAGFFHGEHQECAEQAAEKERAIAAKVAQARALITSAPEGAVSVPELASLIAPIADGNPEVPWRAFCDWITGIANGNLEPSSRQQNLAASLVKQFGFDPQRVPDAGWDKFLHMCAMRDVEDGKLPEVVHFSGDLPFNLEDGERVVWVFDNSGFYEDQVVRSSTRNYGGVSLRVAPGVYVHGGQSVRPESKEGFVHVDQGTLALSDRAVLFQGQHRAIRFRYEDIASFTRSDYGFAICKGSETARQIGFETKDVFPGFPLVLLRGLCQLHAQSG